MFADGNDESSEATGLTNMGDSVNESDNADEDVTESKFIDIRPPTCRNLIRLRRTFEKAGQYLDPIIESYE